MTKKPSSFIMKIKSKYLILFANEWNNLFLVLCVLKHEKLAFQKIQLGNKKRIFKL